MRCKFCGADLSLLHWTFRDALCCGAPECGWANRAELYWMRSRDAAGERTREAADVMRAAADVARRE